MSGGRQRQARDAGETREVPKARQRAGAGSMGGVDQAGEKPGGEPGGPLAGGSAAQPGGPDGGRARLTGSWLGGVRSAGVDLGYPGERLGLPKEGPGASASYGRRLVALFIDWIIALLAVTFVARVFGWTLPPGNPWPLLAFGVETWLLTGLTGVTIGKRMMGLRVVRLDGRPVGLLWSLVRTVLLLMVVPALLWDRDNRGLHDRAADTLVIRA